MGAPEQLWPAQPEDRFRIGGNTKAFVSTLLLRLEAEHRLSLDDPVSRWLPGVVTGTDEGRGERAGRRGVVRQLSSGRAAVYRPRPAPARVRRRSSRRA
ncbi:MAG TPA: serine hydrolase [Pseudonocardiaceae bacterium]|jgi:D-alanyl-D-alanine carboxypeptidase|nr:serine hydrolase [Pseudonocardiaceae bacterium]